MKDIYNGVLKAGIETFLGISSRDLSYYTNEELIKICRLIEEEMKDKYKTSDNYEIKAYCRSKRKWAVFMAYLLESGFDKMEIQEVIQEITGKHMKLNDDITPYDWPSVSEAHLQ